MKAARCGMSGAFKPNRFGIIARRGEAGGSIGFPFHAHVPEALQGAERRCGRVNVTKLVLTQSMLTP